MKKTAIYKENQISFKSPLISQHYEHIVSLQKSARTLTFWGQLPHCPPFEIMFKRNVLESVSSQDYTSDPPKSSKITHSMPRKRIQGGFLQIKIFNDCAERKHVSQFYYQY